jgi:hypothetical protein
LKAVLTTKKISAVVSAWISCFFFGLNGLTNQYPYFLCKPNFTGKLGLSPEQKITAVLQQLAYAVPCDLTEKYF